MNGYDPTDIRAQERARQEQARKGEHEQRVLLDDVSRLMSRKEGRRFVRHLLGAAGTYQSCFSTNALQMAHSEGKREIGQYLLVLLQQACPERYLEMLSEHMKDERSSDRPNAN